MKKILLFLMTLLSLQGQAQLTRVVTFDFQKPTKLSPPVTPSPENGNYVIISNYTFTDTQDEKIMLSFEMNSMYGIAELYTRIIAGVGTQYYVGFSSNAKLKIAGKLGAMITKIIFTGSKKELMVNEGTFDFESNTWTASSESGSSAVLFSNPSTSEPQIMSVTVYYTTTSEVLEPSKAEIIDANGESAKTYSAAATEVLQVPSFKSLDLTFPYDISPLDLAAIAMKDAKDNAVEIVPTCTGKLLSIATKTPIIEDGDFTITVPARSVKGTVDGQEVQNKALPVYQFKVRKIRDIFLPTAVDPEEGEVKSLPQTVKLTFGKDVKLISDANKVVKMYKNGEAMYTVDMSVDKTHKNIVQLKNSHGAIDNSEANLGVWTIVIPDSLIHTVFQKDGTLDPDDYWNPTDTLTWKVVDPLYDKRVEAIALQDSAKVLLALIDSVGYPKADNPENSLAAVISMELATTLEGLDANIASLKAAIKAFYDCTDIKLPLKEKWYAITSVNKDKAELPLSFVDGGVTIGGTPTAFQIEDITDAGFVLRLKVAKDEEGNDVYNYLHVLIGENLYTGMSTTNVLNKKNYLTNLTLGKMLLPAPAEGPAPDQSIVAGLITIKGPMGNLDATGAAVDPAYALVKHGDAPVIATDPAKNTLLFESDFTHAFRFIETEEPQIKPDVPPVTPTFELSEVNMTTHTMTLTIGVVASATLSDATKVKVKQGNVDVTAKITAEKLIEAVTGTQSQFTIYVDGLEAGTYSLFIEKGTFTYEQDNVNESDVTLSFEIPAPSFTKNFEFYGWPIVSGDTPLLDTVLNNIFVYIRKGQVYQDICIDPNKTVTLIDGWNDDIMYRDGKLEYYPDFALPEEYGGADPDLKAYIVRWNPAIEPGEFDNKPFLARVVFPEASFGNEVFGQWLNGEDVKESDCIVNGRIGMTFKIDNEAATQSVDQAAANAVIAKINAIGTVEYTEECKARIDAARAAYDALTDAQKALVPEKTLKILTDAEATYEELATGIMNVTVDNAQEKVVFDLQGRRVAAMTGKGIYIINGKKVIKK